MAMGCMSSDTTTDSGSGGTKPPESDVGIPPMEFDLGNDCPGGVGESCNGLDDDCEPFTPDALIPAGEQCIRNLPVSCGDRFCLKEEITNVDCFQAIDAFTFDQPADFVCIFNGEDDPGCIRSFACLRGDGAAD